MSKKLLKYDIIGFVFVSIIGTLAHFVYEWTNECVIAAFFCPINESPWEHLKLIFFPYLIWTVIQAFIMKGTKNILPAKFIGVFVPIEITAVNDGSAYRRSVAGHIIGRNIDPLNIFSFFIGVFIAFLLDYIIIKSEKMQETSKNITAVILFIIMGAIFILFTFAPPLIPLFKDPITSSYGI